ncbi:hypothetical protein LCGC14_0869510 [marine sediment metagenome]|uniref:Uncharacterized protein n=1 Tax=marine sediment metagenome TaxID=412755 RepID=A0A0F9P554_9ZZZZ
MTTERTLGIEDKMWVNSVLNIILSNCLAESNKATKDAYLEVVFQMIYEGSFFSENTTTGVINLGNFLSEDGFFDFSYFESVIRMAVRFLDNEHIKRGRADRSGKIFIELRDFDAVFDAEKVRDEDGKAKICNNILLFARRHAYFMSGELSKERGSMNFKDTYTTRLADLDLEDFKIRNIIDVKAVSEPDFWG